MSRVKEPVRLRMVVLSLRAAAIDSGLVTAQTIAIWQTIERVIACIFRAVVDHSWVVHRDGSPQDSLR